jgi:fused signal recognition particle receptor
MFGGFFEKLKSGLAKTRNGLTDKISDMLNLYVSIDEDLFEELEEILITSDIGVETSLDIIERVRKKIKENKIKDPKEVKSCLKQVLSEMLSTEETELIDKKSPSIILVVGVNGVGKTTSIGKIAAKLKKQNNKVLLAAGDTFRAAAIDQLEVWSNRAGVDIIRHQEGSDPAAVVFDAIQAAKARKVDVLICDTAGRLHNKKNLMDELNKINRVIDREFSEASRQTLLVLDATTGQNAVQQAKQFMEVCPINGIILTKLDGTAKGGIVVSIKNQLNIPVKLIGVGEGIDDLQDFNAQEFVEALF